MKFSIVTPSFRQPEWLELALASAADQTGIDFEHIVQDGACDASTGEVVRRFPAARWIPETDSGMYDALNKAFARCTGDIGCWLNCDEQYLPGALARAASFFGRNPACDMLLCAVVVVDASGTYHCTRMPLRPSPAHIRYCHLAAFSCGLFFRLDTVRRHGLWFDTRYRSAGDAEWMLRCLQCRLRIQTDARPAAAFTDLSTNLALSKQAAAEGASLRPRHPGARLVAHAVSAIHRARKLLAGHYHPPPLSYAIYTRQSPRRRVLFQVDKPAGLWRNRL